MVVAVNAVIAMLVKPVPPSGSAFRKAVSPIAPIRTVGMMAVADYAGNVPMALSVTRSSVNVR